MGGEHHQRRRLERARPAEWIERVVQVVGPGRHGGTGRAERPNRGDTSRCRLQMRPTLQIEIRRRERDNCDPGCRNRSGDALLVGLRTSPQADAMTRRDGVLEPGRRHHRRELGETIGGRLQRLVGVQVDADAVLGRDAQQRLRRREAVAVRLEVRATADQVGTGLDRVVDEPARVGGARRGNRVGGQRDDLDVDDVSEPAADLAERLHAVDAIVAVHVDVRTYRPEPVGGHQPGGALGPEDRFGDVDLASGRIHREDRAHQVAGLVEHEVGQKRLVEVGVRLDGRGHQHIPAEVDALG